MIDLKAPRVCNLLEMSVDPQFGIDFLVGKSHTLFPLLFDIIFIVFH